MKVILLLYLASYLVLKSRNKIYQIFFTFPGGKYMNTVNTWREETCAWKLGGTYVRTTKQQVARAARRVFRTMSVWIRTVSHDKMNGESRDEIPSIGAVEKREATTLHRSSTQLCRACALPPSRKQMIYSSSGPCISVTKNYF